MNKFSLNDIQFDIRKQACYLLPLNVEHKSTNVPRKL